MTDEVYYAIFDIGAYDPYVVAHATPEQTLAMADQCHLIAHESIRTW